MKAVIDTLDAVPEALRGEYEPHEGKFRLKLEGDPIGFVPAARLAEFRTTNVALLQALGARTVEEGLQRAGLFAGLTPEKIAALKDLDPVEAKAAMERLRALEAKGVGKADDVKALLDAAIAPLKSELETAKAERQAERARADEAVFSGQVQDKFTKAKGRAAALPFIVAQAKAAGFKVEGGQIVPPAGKFDQAGAPLSLDAWLVGTVKEFDFAYEPSTGANAGPGANGSPQPKPGVKQMLNPSPQDLGALKFVAGKGLVDPTGNVVEIVDAPAAA